VISTIDQVTRACQRWRYKQQSWRIDGQGDRFNPAEYEVLPIADDTTARGYVLEHHYSGSYPSALHRFGLYRGGRLVGVAVYSTPTSNAVLTCVLPELVPSTESMELGRFVLEDAVPANAESWMLARCHEYLLAAGVAGVVSFSDPVPRRLPSGALVMPGHIGTIYQATNAVYTGRAWPRSLWVMPDGTIFNGKALQKIRKQERGHEYAERALVGFGARPMQDGENPYEWLRQAKAACRVVTFRHPGVHRYVFALGRNARARAQVFIKAAQHPYPKTIESRELVAA
jgi:hypothetical protein